MAARILSNYPDYGKAPAEYILALSETLATLTTSEIVWLTDSREGLASVCKYLPTRADVHEFLKAKRAKVEQFQSPHTAYKRLNPDVDERPDFDRRKQVVQELLGYNPMTHVKAPVRDLVGKEIPKDASQLKTPAAPASEYLLKRIEEMDRETEEILGRQLYGTAA